MNTLALDELDPSKYSSIGSPKDAPDPTELVTTHPVAEPETGTEATLTTSRKELGAFYLYYVVRFRVVVPQLWTYLTGG